MHHGGGTHAPPPPPRLRRLHPPPRHLYDESRALKPSDPSPASPELSSAGSLRRHIESLMQHHRTIGRSNNRAIQPVSPASYGSSMEITPYNPAITPSSSVDYKGKNNETGYSLKTSTELLKVLNRIWILEEQHASNMSLVKALKKELEHAHTRIKDLVRNQQSDRHKMDEMVKQITEDKLVRKSKEQDWVDSALRSARDELDDERKLRKRSESLHRKLAKELYEVKMSFANASKELEKERKSRELLENLCDEFALGIRDYEREFHSLRPKANKNWRGRAEKDLPTLHVAESWLDERMQMKLISDCDLGENRSVVEKLSSEIETFLQTKRNRRGSLESIPLHMAVSAPRDEGDDTDSDGSGSHCFELQKPSATEVERDIEAMLKPRKLASQEQNKSCRTSNLQVKFQEHMAQATLSSEGRNQLLDDSKQRKDTEENYHISPSKKSGMHEIEEEEEEEEKNTSKIKNKANGTSGLNSNEYSMASFGNSVWRASPVRQWTEKLPSHDNEIFESSSKLPIEIKESKLKAKLQEARARGQRSRSRTKGSKINL